MPDPIQSPNKFAEDYTVYEIDTPSAGIVAGATFNASVQIQADSYFKWTKATYYATIADAAFVDNTRPIPSVTIQIIDGGSNRQLFSSAVPIPNVFGIGTLPFILPVARIFMPRSSINIQLANFDAAVTYRLRLSLIGSKLFEYGSN